MLNRFFCLLLLCQATWALEEPLDIPEEDPVRLQAVHQREFPFANSLQLDVLGGYFYGDRFISSLGAGASAHYFLSETWAVGLEGFLFSNSLDSEGKRLINEQINPRLYNPEHLFRAALVWQPLYGKFAIGDSIQHFVWNIGLGVHMAKERVFQTEGDFFLPDGRRPTDTRTSFTRFGPNVSTRLVFPFGSRWNLTLNFEYFLHSGLEIGSGFGSRKLWFANVGFGVRL